MVTLRVATLSNTRVNTLGVSLFFHGCEKRPRTEELLVQKCQKQSGGKVREKLGKKGLRSFEQAEDKQTVRY